MEKLPEQRSLQEEPGLLPWSEVILMIFAFFQLILPRLLLFCAVAALVTALLALWLN